MSKIFLPTADQMDVTLGHLSKIAGALGSRLDKSSWTDIQEVVRSGNAPEIFPIGTQFTVPHTEYGDIVFDVVAYDYFKSSKNENNHTMTLLSRDVIVSMLFDRAEAFYYAENELPAGTYNFMLSATYNSWAAGTYQFSLTKALPKGGQLAFNKYTDVALTALDVVSYADKITTTATETVAVTEGDGGTSLGTFGIELNHIQRVGQGSNNYKESSIRQFLNSSAEAGNVWTPQTKYDRPPFWVSSTAGFMNGLDADFSSVIGDVVVPCVSNTVYESPDSTVTASSKYSVKDKFYLASAGEISGQHDYEESVLQFPYFKNGAEVDRIKYLSGTKVRWWTRTPNVTGARSIYLIKDTGSVDYSYGITSNGIVIACTIV